MFASDRGGAGSDANVFHWTLYLPKNFTASLHSNFLFLPPKNYKIRKEMGGYRGPDKDSRKSDTKSMELARDASPDSVQLFENPSC